MKIVVGVKTNSQFESVFRVDGPSENTEPHYAVTLKAAPEDNKANLALISLLAKHFKVAKKNVRLVAGQTSRRKVVVIEGL